MGWTTQHREAGISHQKFFESEFRYRDAPEAGLISIKTGGRDTAYAAVRHPKGYVFACVIMLNWDRNDYYNFGYKTIDENMGPLQTHCPQSILNLLTPDTELIEKWPDIWNADGHWLQWRNACRANLTKRRKLQDGTLIRFPEPLTFSNGAELDTFQFNRERTGRGGTRVIFTPPGSTYPRYQIKGWRQLQYEVLEQPTVPNG